MFHNDLVRVDSVCIHSTGAVRIEDTKEVDRNDQRCTI